MLVHMEDKWKRSIYNYRFCWYERALFLLWMSYLFIANNRGTIIWTDFREHVKNFLDSYYEQRYS